MPLWRDAGGTAAAAGPESTSSRAGSSGSAVAAGGIERKYETITQWEDLERWIGQLCTARTCSLSIFKRPAWNT